VAHVHWNSFGGLCARAGPANLSCSGGNKGRALVLSCAVLGLIFRSILLWKIVTFVMEDADIPYEVSFGSLPTLHGRIERYERALTSHDAF
jgi:hypothetical protein